MAIAVPATREKAWIDCGDELDDNDGNKEEQGVACEEAVGIV